MTNHLDTAMKDVLSFIETYTEECGVAPSQREIANACHISKGTVKNVLSKLEQRRLIRRLPGRARGIVLED